MIVGEPRSLQGRSLWRFLTPPSPIFSTLSSTTPLFSVSRLRLLRLGICFLRPCCNYRGALLPLPPLAPSLFFITVDWWLRSYTEAISPPTTGFCASSSLGTHRTVSFTSPNLYRSRKRSGWPPHTNRAAANGVKVEDTYREEMGAGFPTLTWGDNGAHKIKN